MKKIFFFVQVLAILLFTGNIAHGQIEITLCLSGLLKIWLKILSARESSFPMCSILVQIRQAAIFTNGSSTNLGIESGILLTSGSGNLVPGPNNDSFARGCKLLLQGDSLLTSITTEHNLRCIHT